MKFYIVSKHLPRRQLFIRRQKFILSALVQMCVHPDSIQREMSNISRKSPKNFIIIRLNKSKQKTNPK